MMDFIVVNVYLGRIRDAIIGAMSAKFAEAIVKNMTHENLIQRQEIVKSYQTTPMKDKTFISEMLRYEAPFDQIVNVLVEEQCPLLEGGLVFEAEISQTAFIWGKRSVRTNILNKKQGKEKVKYFEENNPLILNVPRNLFEEHSMVVVNKSGEYKVYTTATNHPEIYQYQQDLWDSAAKHCRDLLDFKTQWASISEAQMRLIYRNRYKQKQQQIEHSHEPKTEQQRQYIIAEPAIPLSQYDIAGRNFHYKPIGIGVVVWFFALASIWWLSDETREEKKN